MNSKNVPDSLLSYQGIIIISKKSSVAISLTRHLYRSLIQVDQSQLDLVCYREDNRMQNQSSYALEYLRYKLPL